MDLGLAGRKAIVCASSKGLGKACALNLARAGCDIVMNGRNADVLDQAAKAVAKETGVKVLAVAGDLSEPKCREALLAACPEPDILINNNGGPPPQDFLAVSRDDLLRGVEANMAVPIALIQSVIEGMAARRFGRIVNITSCSVKMPILGLDVSSGARAGLTAFTAAAARRYVDRNVTINHILPGIFDTDRIRQASANQAAMRNISEEELQKERQSAIPAKRYGQPEEFGRLCAFLASAHSGFITGQSILIDGGAFNAVI